MLAMGVLSLLDFFSLFLCPGFVLFFLVLDFIDMHCLHLSPKGLHLLPVAVGLTHPQSLQNGKVCVFVFAGKIRWRRVYRLVISLDPEGELFP